MLDYPEDFDTSAFPAGRRIAVSRTAGIWIAVSLFSILVCGIALPLVSMYQKVEPVVIYVDATHGTWEMIQDTVDTVPRKELPYYQMLQSSLVGVFAEKWFSISGTTSQNDLMWMRCNRATDCTGRMVNTLRDTGGCDLFCMSGDDLYKKFESTVAPLYEIAVSYGEVWRVNTRDISIEPYGDITTKSGNWVVHMRVRRVNQNSDFGVVAFVRVERNEKLYPQTLGYYIADFNAYKEQ